MRLYCIENRDAQSQAIVSEKGGQVISYVQDGREIIFLQRIVESKLRGGIPICFPFFGSPKPRFADIRQHGWLRDEDLVLVNEWYNCIRFKGTSKNRKYYPWSLEYEVSTYITSLGALEMKLKVKRLEDGIKEDAPINPAPHPYFTNLGQRAVKIGQREIENFGNKAERIPLNGEKEIIIDLGKKKVKMLLTNDFEEESCVTLWSDSKQYFCVEPSLTHPDDFDTPKGKYLKQGEILTLGCILSVLP